MEEWFVRAFEVVDRSILDGAGRVMWRAWLGSGQFLGRAVMAAKTALGNEGAQGGEDWGRCPEREA